MPVKTVFLSSTFRDLAQHREAIGGATRFADTTLKTRIN